MEHEIRSGAIGEDGENDERPEENQDLEGHEVDDDEELEARLNETVEETIKRTQEEVQEKSEDKPTKEHKQPTGTQSKGNEKPFDNQSKQEAIETDPAPQRFSVQAKEAWKLAPPVLKKEYAKAIQDLENGQRQKLREIHEYKQQAEPIIHAVSPWAKDWAKEGISVPQGVALLAQTHENLIKNPAQELARLIRDNGVSLQEVQAVMEGKASPDTNNGTGYGNDITQHPQFLALQNQFNQLNNQITSQTVQAETDKIKALRNEVDANGNRPYEYILDPAFIQYAQPLVNALRTPPRDAQGKFVAGGKIPSITDAYKRAYHTWLSENGISTQNQATGTQPFNSAQPQQKQQQPISQPISFRSRKAPAGRPTSPNGDPSQHLHETVEETMRRIRGEVLQN